MYYRMYGKRAAETCTTGGTCRLRLEPVRSSSVPTGGKDVVAKFAPEDVDEDPRHHQHNPTAPWPVRKGGIALTLYNHSLSLALGLLFLLSFLGHAASGSKHYNEEQHEHGQPPISMLQYVGTSRFWFESFQNWQSEFLAVGAVVVLSIWLREKGSPESKAVHSAHDDTGR